MRRRELIRNGLILPSPTLAAPESGPRFISAQAAPSAAPALSGDPPRPSAAPRAHEVRGEVPSSGGAGAGGPACSHGGGPLPGSSPPLTREPPSPGFPATASTRERHGRRGLFPAQVRSRAVPCGPPLGALLGPRGALPAPEQRPAGGREGLGEKLLSPAQVLNLPSNEGGGGVTPSLPRGFHSVFSPTPPPREDTRTSLIKPLTTALPSPRGFSEGAADRTGK